MADHVHDLIGAGDFVGRIKHTGINNRRYRVHFDGYSDIVFNLLIPMPKNQEPKLLSMVTFSDLDDSS